MNETTHYRLAIVIATLKAYLAVWFLVVAVSLGAYIVEISSPMMGDISWQQAGRFGSSLFLSALGGQLHLEGVAFGLIPLTLTILLAVLVYVSLRREGLASVGEYLSCVATSLVITFLAWLPSLPGTHLLPALVGALTLSGIVAGIVWYQFVHSEGADEVTKDVSVETPHLRRLGFRARRHVAQEPSTQNLNAQKDVAGADSVNAESSAHEIPAWEKADGRELLDFLRHGGTGPRVAADTPVADAPADMHKDTDARGSVEDAHPDKASTENVTSSPRISGAESDKHEGISIRSAAAHLLSYVRQGWYLAGPLLACLGIIVTLGVILRIGMRWSEVESLASYYEMSVLEQCGFALLQFFYAPTMLIYAAAYATGAGFTLGSGITFSALGNHLGPLPAIPVLGALPQVHVRAVWMIVVIVLIACGIGAWRGWRLSVGKRLRAWVLALVELFALASVSARLASGSLGAGALAMWGVDSLRFALAVLLECGGGLALGLFLFNPSTWRAVQQGLARWRQARAGKRIASTDKENVEMVTPELSEGRLRHNVAGDVSVADRDTAGEEPQV